MAKRNDLVLGTVQCFTKALNLENELGKNELLIFEMNF